MIYVFFYHSGKEKRIIEIVKIIKEYFREETNKFISVMVQEEDKLSKPVTLKKIKNYKLFKEFSPIKQSQSSIVEIDTKYWKKTCKMSNMG